MKFIVAALVLLSIDAMAVIDGRSVQGGVGDSEGSQVFLRGVQFYDPFLMKVDKSYQLYLSGERLAKVPESCRAIFLAKIQLARKRGTWLKIKPQLFQNWQTLNHCCDIELRNLASDLPSQYGISNFLVFKERTVFQKSSFDKFIAPKEKSSRACCSPSWFSKSQKKLPTEQYFLMGRRIPTEYYPAPWLAVLDKLLLDPEVHEIAVFLDPVYDPETYRNLDANILFTPVEN